MMKPINQNRRHFIKLSGAAVAFIPVAAFAAKNEAIRKQMQYKDITFFSCNRCHSVNQRSPIN